VKKFVYLTFGFEKPTPEIMQAWKKWFEEIKSNILEQGHFPRGHEISKSGAKPLPMGPDSITGYVMVKAESFDDAVKMAETNPFIKSIRIYEVMAG